MVLWRKKEVSDEAKAARLQAEMARVHATAQQQKTLSVVTALAQCRENNHFILAVNPGRGKQA